MMEILDTPVFSMKCCFVRPCADVANFEPLAFSVCSVRRVFEGCTKFSAVADGQAPGSLPFLQALQPEGIGSEANACVPAVGELHYANLLNPCTCFFFPTMKSSRVLYFVYLYILFVICAKWFGKHSLSLELLALVLIFTTVLTRLIRLAVVFGTRVNPPRKHRSSSESTVGATW